MKDDRPYQYNSTLKVPRERMKPMSDKRRRERGMPGTRKYGPHHVYVMMQYDCVIVDHPRHTCWHPDDAKYPVDSHHIVPSEGDAANCVPACRLAHGIFHDLACDNERIKREWNVDLEAIASDIWAKSPHRPKESTACTLCDEDGMVEGQTGGNGYAIQDVMKVCPECGGTKVVGDE